MKLKFHYPIFATGFGTGMMHFDTRQRILMYANK